MIVRMSHVRGVHGMSTRGGLCAPSIRQWCRANGIDVGDFVRNGIAEERLLAIAGDNAFVQAVVAHARRTESPNG